MTTKNPDQRVNGQELIKSLKVHPESKDNKELELQKVLRKN